MREAEDCEGKFTDEGLKTLFEHLHKQVLQEQIPLI
jgi:hypothetical protein